MEISNKSLKVKRQHKKVISQKTAIKIKVFVENNYPEDEKIIKRMVRQIMCAGRLEVYDNDVVKTYFCKQKTCLVCNSIRLAKFLSKTLDYIDQSGNILYHMVLTVRNPSVEDLKETIDKMYGFFKNSSLKKIKRYKELNKKIMFIRSFEATLKEENRTFHIHFHILLTGKIESEVKEYGDLIIKYWLKYFGEKANKKAQYLEEQKKSILENFKYLFKLNDISDSNIRMLYHFLKATEGRRLFTAKKLPRDKSLKKALKELQFNDVENANRIDAFHFHKDAQNWISPFTGELFVNDSDIEEYEIEILEKRNYKELKRFFDKMSEDKK